MAQSVRYVPAQEDPMASLSTRAARQSPIRLMLLDTWVLLTNIRYLPNIILPFKTTKSSDELYLDFPGIRESIIQCVLFVLEAVLLLVAIPLYVILPGALWILVVAVCCLTVYGLCKPIEGPTVLHSNMNGATLALADQHRDERWLFVNGCIVGWGPRRLRICALVDCS